MKRNLQITIVKTKNTSRIFTEVMLEMLKRHPELATPKKREGY